MKIITGTMSDAHRLPAAGLAFLGTLLIAAALGLWGLKTSAPSSSRPLIASLPLETPVESADTPRHLIAALSTRAALARATPETLPAPTPTTLPPRDSEAPPAPETGPAEAVAAFPHPPQAPAIETRTLSVKAGQTLMAVLVKAGIPRQQAFEAIKAMTPKLNPRRIRAGQEITISTRLEPQETDGLVLAGLATRMPEAAPTLVGFELKTDVDRKLAITRQEDGAYTAEEIVTPLEERFVHVRGVIENSLFLTAQRLNIPPSIIIELIRMYSYDVDFQREIRKGDSFEVFYTRYFDEEGNALKDGEIYFGNLILRGKELAYYRFMTPDDQITDYYDRKGKSAKKFLMRTPVDGARISSGFGRRRHPVLGYTKMHKGIDFAAPRGTPIMAAGNGVIERANRFGSFGNYIRIRHANGYQTIYAHLKGFAKGIRKGARVKQGQIIGYIGTTGRSTGPHLHYEIHVNGKTTNPMTIRVPTGRKLKGKILDAFQKRRAELEALMARTPLTPHLAAAAMNAETDPATN